MFLFLIPHFSITQSQTNKNRENLNLKILNYGISSKENSKKPIIFVFHAYCYEKLNSGPLSNSVLFYYCELCVIMSVIIVIADIV
jgi:hypothetical protein